VKMGGVRPRTLGAGLVLNVLIPLWGAVKLENRYCPAHRPTSTDKQTSVQTKNNADPSRWPRRQADLATFKRGATVVVTIVTRKYRKA
jgi:hypothetical protein